MKLTLTLLSMLSVFAVAAQQNHCEQDRYAQIALFDSADIEQSVHVYSIEETWPSTALDTLEIEIYKPAGAVDLITRRPFILMIHGGAFLEGNRDDMGYFSMEMARRGFVTGSMDYRLGWDCTVVNPITLCGDCGWESGKLKVATYRAVQDTKAALNYIIENADALGIDTSQIYIQGESAGAITALHTAYWNQSEADAWCPTCAAEVGNLNATGISPQHDIEIKGVINNCGAVHSLSIMDSTAIPVVGFHDDLDCTVPYGNGQVLSCLGCTSFYYASGSNAIRSKLNAEGVCYGMNTVAFSLNHCSYPRGAIVGKAACFLKGLLCDQCTSYQSTSIWDIPDCMAGTVNTNISHSSIDPLEVYPNPATGLLHIRSNGQKISKVILYNIDGKACTHFSLNAVESTLEVTGLANGIYFINITFDNGETAVQSLIVSH